MCLLSARKYPQVVWPLPVETRCWSDPSAFMIIMNADGSDQHLVSTGKGQTTCGYFLADNKHIVYSSTHLAGDACPVPPDRSKGYVWPVYASYDIFLATDSGK